MVLLGLLAVLCFLEGVPAPPHGVSKLCKTCAHVPHPDNCTTYDHCGGLEECFTEVSTRASGLVWHFGCKGHHECDEILHPDLAKRHEHHHPDETIVCNQCCQTNECNKNLCAAFDIHTTIGAPVTTASTTPSVTSPDSSCRNYESETFLCSELDKYDFCNDVSSIAYGIAHDKCAKHCGLCDVTKPTFHSAFSTDVVNVVIEVTQAPAIVTSVSTGDCVDTNDPTLSCLELKNLGFCAPGSGSGHTFAELRCPKTCGTCS